MKSGLTLKQVDTIKDNLNAYIHNFEKPIIVPEEFGHGFYVYRNSSERQSGEKYVQYCYNIDYLNGWLYGAVQAKCKQLRAEERE